MKNIQDIINIGLCTSCSACYSACPKGYIAFKADGGMGFPVPNVENCDDCGCCLKVCPSSDLYEDDEDDEE